MKGQKYQVAWHNDVDPTRFTDVIATNAESAIRKVRSIFRDEYPKPSQMKIVEVYKI